MKSIKLSSATVINSIPYRFVEAIRDQRPIELTPTEALMQYVHTHDIELVPEPNFASYLAIIRERKNPDRQEDQRVNPGQ